MAKKESHSLQILNNPFYFWIKHSDDFNWTVLEVPLSSQIFILVIMQCVCGFNSSVWWFSLYISLCVFKHYNIFHWMVKVSNEHGMIITWNSRHGFVYALASNYIGWCQSLWLFHFYCFGTTAALTNHLSHVFDFTVDLCVLFVSASLLFFIDLFRMPNASIGEASSRTYLFAIT